LAVTDTAVASTYSGPITGFGSVIVNGVRFSSTGAAVQDLDNNAMSHSDLHIGTTVKISGSANDVAGTGTAANIVVVHGVRGAITAIAAPELTVLGQKIVTDAKTAYENTTGLAALAVGDKVETYGATQADGSFLASLIEKKVFSDASLPGVVSNLNASAKTFSLNTLTVNYSTATVTGILANGARVRVKASAAPVAGVLTATQVTVHTENTANAGVVKIKGIASAAPVNGVVTVSGTTVDVSNATYLGGTAIVAGSKLEVRGTWSGTTLVANQVMFDGVRENQLGGSNELYGVVTAYTSVSNFVVNGVTVDASAVTGLTLPLAVGSYVEIKGNMVGNVLKAKSVEIKNGSAPTGGFFETTGVISNYVSISSFTVNAMSVNAAGAKIEGGASTLAALANGKKVSLKGAKNAAGVFIATQLELD
jgi:Domain of unknown function (DUF5666)